MATLYLRNVDQGVVREAKMAALALDITVGEYLHRLVNMHMIAVRRDDSYVLKQLLEDTELARPER